MRIISFINMKGGVGKTTLATNFCNNLAVRDRKKVLLIDMDPQFNATQCFLSGKDYVDYCKKGGETITTLFDGSAVKVSSVDGTTDTKRKTFADIHPLKCKENLYLLPGDLNLHKISFASGKGLEYRLQQYITDINVHYSFDFVVVDTPPTPSVWMTSSLIASNYYVIPVKPDPLSYTGVDLLKNIINELTDNYNLSIACIGLVMTMVEEDTIVYREAVKFVKSDPHWKKYYVDKCILKRTNVPKWQLNHEFINDIDDPKLKSGLAGVVNEIIKNIEKYEEAHKK